MAEGAEMKIICLEIESGPAETVVVAESVERARELSSRFQNNADWLKAKEKWSYKLGSKTTEKISRERVLSSENKASA